MQKQAAPLLGPAEVEGSDARASGGQLSEGRVLGNCNSEKNRNFERFCNFARYFGAKKHQNK